MSTFQFTSIDPEKLKRDIADAVRAELKTALAQLKGLKPDELLTRKETARILKCSLTALYLWTKAGKITACGIGNRVYYRRSEVDRCTQILDL